MQLGLLAKRRHIVHDDLRRLIRLAFLAPPIVELIAQGRRPAELTVEILTRRTLLPLEWQAQKWRLAI